MSCNNEIIDSDNLVEHGNTQKNLDYHENNNGNENNICQELVSDKPVAKKRGRKPKGGKIIQQIIPLSNLKENRPNVILHLKCSLKDLQFNSFLNSKIENYDLFSSNNDFLLDISLFS
jgi:hypothetical protein